MGAALRRPLADVVVLRRDRGRSGTFVDVFVSLSERSPAVIEALGGRVMTRAGSLFGARVPLSALRALGADSRVRYVKAARRVKPNNDLAMQDIRASLVRTETNGIFTGATGSNVIVGTFDTGIDWSHPDFKHPDRTTRIPYIWDLTATGTPPGNVGGQVFDHGNECSAALINAGGCSERDVAAHGSHVAGTAAGDGSGGSPYQYAGVAPNADIIAVKGGNVSFSSLDIVEGIQYIFKRADVLGRPAVVNLSLGSDFGPHDGTEAEEQAIDTLVGPGHIVVIAAGNSGSNPTAITGNSPPSYLHATRPLITGDTAQLGVTVPVYTPASGAINDYMYFNMWYDGRDSITITVRRPDGTTFTRSTGEPDGDDEGPAGHVYLDNASGGVEPQNGDRQAVILIYDEDPTHPPAAGTWVITVRLDRLGGSGRFDVWEWETSSTLAGSQISGGGDNAYLVGSPGNAARAITVAAHVNRVSWTAQAGNYQYVVREQVGDLATFSSSGPTRPVRDGPSRQKPDLSAPGKGVFSVYSSAASPPAPGALIAPDGMHWLLSGTSMSTPMVTGSVALLLERKPDLTPEQVRAILTGSARQDGFTGVSYAGFGGGVPNPSWGFGKLDVQAALALVPLNLTATKGPRDDSLGGRFVLPRANIPSIQLRIVGDSVSDIRLTGITLQSTGSGNEPAAVTAVHLYADGDSNGVVGPGDVLLGSATVTQDDGAAVLGGLSYVVAHRTTGYLLGTYDLNGTPRQGDTFRLSLLASSSVTAQRVSDGGAVSLSGGRVTGSVVVVQLIGSVAAASGGSLVSPIAALGGPNAVLLRVDATAASPETVSVRRLVGRFGGTANPAATLENVRLLRDANDNGVVDAADPVESVLAPTVAGSALAVDLSTPGDPRLPTGITRHWLVVAGIKAGAVESTTVSFTLDSLRGLGLVTDSAVVATGPPLSNAGVTLVATTLALGGPAPDSVEVLRGRFVTLARLRFAVKGEPVRIDSMLFHVTGSLPLRSLGSFVLFQDVDSNGVRDPNEPAIGFAASSGPGDAIHMAPSPGVALAAGTQWWGLLGMIGADATWGQTTQERLDSAAIFARGTVSGVLPARLGAASVTGRLYSVGGQAELTAAAGTRSPNARLRIGANAALQFVVSVSTLEGARLDTISVAAASSHALADVVTELDLYRDSTGAGTVPSGPPLAVLTAPFAAGATPSFAGVGTSLSPGTQVTYLLVLRLNDRLRQGDTLGLRLTAVSGTGALSARHAVAGTPVPVASRLGSATLLEAGEAFLISENPVRSGRVIFSYDLPPRSMALYSFAGLRVRDFTGLPASGFEWDVRGETPGLPNGMYILVVDTGSKLLRQRLMILSPAR